MYTRTDERPSGNQGGAGHLVNRLIDTHMTRFVRRTNAESAGLFQRDYVCPDDTWASLAHHEFAYVTRDERPDDDFGKVRSRIGLEQLRPVPLANTTAAGWHDYVSLLPNQDLRQGTAGPRAMGNRLPAECGL